jgi:metallo-beta-lactamase family protein
MPSQLENTINIQHHGATRGVTGSCHQLFWSGGRSVLVDCGLFQGAETAPDGSHAEQLAINFPVDEIDALIVTHVHIDHVGRIPYLLAAGFNGPVYCTEPSAHLLPLVLEDALKIGFTRNQRLIQRFLQQIKQQLKPLPYKTWQTVAQNKNDQLRIKLQPAGHILGSAYVECDVKTAKQHTRVTFSGDLGAPYSPLLPAPRSPYRSDMLVIESTYGDKNHSQRKQRRKQLLDIVQRAVQDKGVILIPAFSIGRTQELLYEIEELTHRKQIDLEVVVDSPLAARFTASYRTLKKYWDQEAQTKLKQGRHPLAFEPLWTVDSHREHQQTVAYLRKTAKPTIVIAASGMCSGGRIMNYLKALIEDLRTDIVFVGYQADGTPGRTIQRYGAQNGWVELDGQRYTINAKIHTLSGYSAHADQQNLVDFVKRMHHKPQHIRIVHGDDQAKQVLQGKLQQLLPGADVVVPA